MKLDTLPAFRPSTARPMALLALALGTMLALVLGARPAAAQPKALNTAPPQAFLDALAATDRAERDLRAVEQDLGKELAYVLPVLQPQELRAYIDDFHAQRGTKRHVTALHQARLKLRQELCVQDAAGKRYELRDSVRLARKFEGQNYVTGGYLPEVVRAYEQLAQDPVTARAALRFGARVTSAAQDDLSQWVAGNRYGITVRAVEQKMGSVAAVQVVTAEWSPAGGAALLSQLFQEAIAQGDASLKSAATATALLQAPPKDFGKRLAQLQGAAKGSGSAQALAAMALAAKLMVLASEPNAKQAMQSTLEAVDTGVGLTEQYALATGRNALGERLGVFGSISGRAVAGLAVVIIVSDFPKSTTERCLALVELAANAAVLLETASAGTATAIAGAVLAATTSARLVLSVMDAREKTALRAVMQPRLERSAAFFRTRPKTKNDITMAGLTLDHPARIAELRSVGFGTDELREVLSKHRGLLYADSLAGLLRIREVFGLAPAHLLGLAQALRSAGDEANAIPGLADGESVRRFARMFQSFPFDKQTCPKNNAACEAARKSWLASMDSTAQGYDKNSLYRYEARIVRAAATYLRAP